MKNSLLIIALSSLSKKEMTTFRNFVESPYFTKNEEQRRLLAYLHQLHPKFANAKVSREAINLKLGNKSNATRKRLDLLFSRTYQLYKKFCAIEAFQQDQLRESIYLLKSLHAKELRALFEREQARCFTEYDKFPYKDAAYYMAGYQLEHELEDYHMHYSRLLESKNFYRKIVHLDNFYFAQKLKDACEMIVKKRVLDIDYHSVLLEEVIAKIETELDAYKSVSPIIIYYYIYKMISTADSDYYFKLIETLPAHLESFREEEQHYIYDFAKNYCIQQVNAGQQDFLNNLFEIYKLELKGGLTARSGKFSEWHYKNIVTVGLRLREFDWTYQFIEEYKSFLPPRISENAYLFNLASYHNAVGNYDKTLTLLLNVEFTDVRYNLGSKALLLRNYYEAMEYDALLSSAEAFRNYLRRNKVLSEERKEGYLNLIRLTVKMAKLRSQHKFIAAEEYDRQLQRLRSEIDDTSSVFNIRWVKSKLELLSQA